MTDAMRFGSEFAGYLSGAILNVLRRAKNTIGSAPSSQGKVRNDKYWTRIMTPERGWFDIDFRELLRYRDLVWLFVWRDFVATYKQTVLGPAWFFISPLLTAVVFTVVFGEIAQIPTDGMPPFLFYFCGTVCWGFFARCLVEISAVFATNAHLFGKVYFPRLATPVAALLSNGIKLAIQFGILLGFLLYFKFTGTPIKTTVWTLAVPLLVLQAGILGLAGGLIISSLTTKYRDLQHFVHFGIQLWMYATPVVYPLSEIPERYSWFFVLNPMVLVVEGFRKGLLGTGTITTWMVVTSISVSLLLLVVGLGLFTKTENTFMDRI